MNFEYFFSKAREKGVNSCQIVLKRAKSTGVTLYHHNIDDYGVSEDISIAACGIYKGKFGSCVSQKCNREALDFLIDGIIRSASLSEKEHALDIFPGSEKYKKWNPFNKGLSSVSINEKIKLIKDIEDELYSATPLLNEVDNVTYEESETVFEFRNSYGLKLKQKSNQFIVYASVNGKDKENVKNGYYLYFGNDYSKFDKAEFIKETVDRLVSQFGGTSYKTGVYPVVLSQNVFGVLVDYFLSTLIAEAVQKRSSKMEGMLEKQVAAKCLTISEEPLRKNPFYTYFDDEGVATFNKKVVDHGVLKTYFYNRETARKDNVETTANGSWGGGGKIGTSYTNIVIKPSRKSFEALIKPIREGIYIESVQGLGTGLNSESGDFSCQAKGHLILEGKIDRPLTLITLSGNFYKMLKEIIGLDNSSKLLSNGITCPNACIKEMSVAGE